MTVLKCGRYTLDLSRPLIMGIVNVTPDSFADDALLRTPADAVACALRLVDEGADIIDIGGESTRPGAVAVSLEEERRRVLPVLEQLVARSLPISVDTRKPQLMREVIAAGAAMINDINALGLPEAQEAVAASEAAVCLMHKRGEPGDMQRDPTYGDVVAEILGFLRERVDQVSSLGVSPERIVVDPGFGFGKTLEHNLLLMQRLEVFADIGATLLVGTSRKSMLGRITGRGVKDRAFASVASALIAVQKGARIVRVHDVAATRDALTVWQAIRDTALVSETAVPTN